MTTLTIWGGAGEHGRSSYLLHNGQSGILLDCGVKKEGQGEYPLLDPEIIPQLQAVFLSHAHEDHSIALPLLYKYGYTGKVWTTRATAGQLPGYFAAWHAYAAAQSAPLPYDGADVQAIQFMYLEEHAAPGTWLTAEPGLRLQWGRSGHLAGAVWLALEWAGKSVFFSGDYTDESLLLAADAPVGLFLPAAGTDAGGGHIGRWHTGRGHIGRWHTGRGHDGDAWGDLAIIDAAYGADLDPQRTKLQQLEGAIRNTLQSGGSVLLPVPVHGRSQELLVWASERFPDIPFIVEEELMAPLNSLTAGREWLRADALARLVALARHTNLHVISSLSEREQALEQVLRPSQASIIFTNDGMLQSAKAQWYYQQLSATAGNHLIFTGHLPADSFGRALLEQSKADSCALQRCTISFIRYKVHQGLPDIRRMLQTVPSRRTVLVHAPKQPTDYVASILEEEGFTGLYSLLPGDSILF